MMKSFASFKITGLKELQASLNRKLGKLDTKKFNAQAVAATDRWIQKNFQTQGRLAHPGTGWKPLSPVTLMMRRSGPKKTGRVMILQDTGTMRSRWKHFWDIRIAKIQAGVHYAYKHHFGKEGLSVRRILPTQKQIGPIIRKIGEVWLRKGLK